MLPKNIGKVFWGYNLLWHLLAILLTYFLVISGFDWHYFETFQNTLIYKFLFPAAIIGGLLPIIIPLILYAVAKTKKNLKTLNTTFGLAQAGIIAWLVSSFYKAITGRVPPEFPRGLTIHDISKVFRFGFMRGGIFWGWPSSHTAVAFAMSVALMILYPKNKTLKYLALIYAVYVGFGVSISIHWFSDFVAGAIIGTVIGITVGKSFAANFKRSAFNENRNTFDKNIG